MDNKKVSNKIDELIFTKKEFKEAFSGIYAVSQEEIRPILQCVHFEDNDVVCLDGYRLSIRKLNKSLNSSFNIHIDDVKRFMKLLPKNYKEVKFNIYDSEFSVEVDSITIFSGDLIEATYINYKSILPYSLEDHSHIILNKKDFKELYEGYRIRKYPTDELMKFTLKNRELIINNKFPSCLENNPRGLYKVMEYGGNFDFKNHEFAINPKFIKQTINSYTIKDNINFYIYHNPSSPIIIKSDDENMYDLILPIRIYR